MMKTKANNRLANKERKKKIWMSPVHIIIRNLHIYIFQINVKQQEEQNE